MNKNKSLRTVAALFTREDSIYATLPGVDSWPMSRDALNWPGGAPVVAHPPCRSWSRFSHLAKPAPGEHDLAVWAVYQVRKNGGVLEHPAFSKLWERVGLPLPSQPVDDLGGWTLSVDQYWWGHEAKKPTWLYIVGWPFKHDMRLPFALGDAPKVVSSNRANRNKQRKRGRLLRPELSKADRARTPPEFAEWLVDLARRSSV